MVGNEYPGHGVRRMSAVHVGDKVIRRPVTFTGINDKKPLVLQGIVIWIHPKRRFHVVEFATEGGSLRECFTGFDHEA